MAAAVQILQGQTPTSFEGGMPRGPSEPSHQLLEDTVFALGELSSRFAAQQEAAQAALPQRESHACLQRQQPALSQGDHVLRRKTPNGTVDNGFDASFGAFDLCAPRYKQLRAPDINRRGHRLYEPASMSFSDHRALAAYSGQQQLAATTSNQTSLPTPARPNVNSHAHYHLQAVDPKLGSLNLNHSFVTTATEKHHTLHHLPRYLDSTAITNIDTAPATSSACVAVPVDSFQQTKYEMYLRQYSATSQQHQITHSALQHSGPFIHLDALLSKAATCFDRLVCLRKQWLNTVCSRTKGIPPHMSIIPTLRHLHRRSSSDCHKKYSLQVLGKHRQVRAAYESSHSCQVNQHHQAAVQQSMTEKRNESFSSGGFLHGHNASATFTIRQHADLYPIDLAGESPDDCTHTARLVLTALHLECERSEPIWPDGLLYAGCLAYMLMDWRTAHCHFTRILKIDRTHSEALSNLAACCLALNCPRDAEHYWRCAINSNPASFDSIEHLVGLLCLEQRQTDAVQLIHNFEQRLKSTDGCLGPPKSVFMPATQPHVPFHVRVEYDFKQLQISGHDDAHLYPCLKKDIGRFMALVHAKGNMLYAMRDYPAAAEAFQEVALAATNYLFQDIRSFTEHVMRSIQPLNPIMRNHMDPAGCPLLASLMLPPDQALQTASLCFGSPARPPGLMNIRSRSSFKSAISVLSNALLSLAKILQDVASSGPSQFSAQLPSLETSHILALYYLSLSLQPSPSTANNVGILLANINQPALISKGGAVTTAMPTYPGVVPGSGVSLALAYYHYGLTLDPRHAHLYTNLGSLLKDIGQLSQSIQMYERAVALDPAFDIALANLANAVKDQGRIKDAIGYYKQAVMANPEFSEALCGLANALNSVCEWNGRGGAYIEGFDRWHVDTEGMLTDSFSSLASSSCGWISRVIHVVNRQLGDGDRWGRGLFRGEITKLASMPVVQRSQGQYDVESLLKEWIGRPWEGANMTRFIERLTRIIGREWYVDKYVRQKGSDARAYLRPVLPAALSVPTSPTVLPFHTFTMPMSAQQIRMISQRNALRVSVLTLKQPWLPPTVFPPPQPPSPYLKVGYVSSDFNNHPLAHLMQSVFGLHDHRRVKAFCYATSQSDKSTYRLKIEQEAPSFHDVSAWSTEKIISQIVRDGIHILVNLNGYTRGARNEIFAARPAPIQISLMGFAGSLGAEWCDYLLADEIAVPKAALRPHRGNVSIEDLAKDGNYQDQFPNDWVYSENIIYARDAFFCCDHRQSAHLTRSRALSQDNDWSQELRNRWQMRRELFPDLSADTVIMANFNQLYKIDPTTFRTWLRILAAVPSAILWLLKFPEAGEQNLLQTASTWAGTAVASRIRFTGVAPKLVHIARGCIADVFLDTPECNAHTTAADCLWSGTPILTLPRYPWKMCSRMAAGILRGALPKDKHGERALKCLIVNTEEEYESRAIELCKELEYDREKPEDGRAMGRLMEFRRVIWENRRSCALFDTSRWTRDLEFAYEEAWRRWVTAEGGDIWLKDIVKDQTL